MSKKSDKGRRKKSTLGRSKGGPQVAPVDRRALEKGISDIGRSLAAQNFETEAELEAFMEKLLVGRGLEDLASVAPATSTPLEQAQDLMYEAWDAVGTARVTLARRALALSQDCADAYVLLAEETSRSVEDAKLLYEQGVQAGERALGPKAFAEDAGYFWGILETRPYMRARVGLAQCLWLLGRREEAIGHYVEMLRLNPNDNQGIRYVLSSCLLQTGDDVALGELLERYEEDISADWVYTRALYRFRQGDSGQAKAALQEALEANPFVPSYLLGKKRVPKRLPEYVGFGDESEAQAYVAEAAPIWRNTSGALDWLAEAVSRGSDLSR
jgi:tetratricopeptide (TPR) repeat protein